LRLLYSLLEVLLQSLARTMPSTATALQRTAVPSTATTEQRDGGALCTVSWCAPCTAFAQALGTTPDRMHLIWYILSGVVFSASAKAVQALHCPLYQEGPDHLLHLVCSCDWSVSWTLIACQLCIEGAQLAFTWFPVFVYIRYIAMWFVAQDVP
jgi:hypothetical protein